MLKDKPTPYPTAITGGSSRKDKQSPYSAAITGGGFLAEETDKLLPLLRSQDRTVLIKDEAVNNRLLHINAETSRKKAIIEIARRFDTMPVSFWDDYQEMPAQDKRIALFYVILKTYKILFDFHVAVTIRKWNSISKTITLDDLMLEMNEIASADDFVDSWSEQTKKKVASAYLTILRRIGILDQSDTLHQIADIDFTYYLRHGEAWFLEACLLQPYQIEDIKKSLS